jgi:hypothetical protein
LFPVIEAFEIVAVPGKTIPIPPAVGFAVPEEAAVVAFTTLLLTVLSLSVRVP